ncbi:hypothetical protein MD484_g7822, partial [Candolleomyces efflorescens]
MQRLGTDSENKFVDVSAAFLEQSRKEGLSREFKVVWFRVFVQTFPSRALRPITPDERVEIQRRKREGLPDGHLDPAWIFMKLLWKEMAWQTYAWRKHSPGIHWTQWCSQSLERRNETTDRIHEQFLRMQRELLTKSTDELFGLPGSCRELAIELDDT